MKQFIAGLLFFIGLHVLHAQELNCKVVINAEQIQTTERNVFQDMETAFAQFVNGQKWTEDQFEVEERINCNIILTLDPNESDPASGNWGASVQIVSSRPVYKTDFETVVFNFADRDWQFEYLQSQPLIFNENSFSSNITSLLAYYVYTILGLDYDTFSELGGTPYFQVANQIVVNAQNTSFPGWSQFNSIRNRYWLNENLLSANFNPLRKAMYNYHLKGLDIMLEDPETARENILQGLRDIQEANRTRPRSIITISFLDAKATELTNVFKDAEPNQKKEAFEILSKLDPSRTETFRKIME